MVFMKFLNLQTINLRICMSQRRIRTHPIMLNYKGFCFCNCKNIIIYDSILQCNGHKKGNWILQTHTCQFPTPQKHTVEHITNYVHQLVQNVSHDILLATNRNIHDIKFTNSTENLPSLPNEIGILHTSKEKLLQSQ